MGRRRYERERDYEYEREREDRYRDRYEGGGRRYYSYRNRRDRRREERQIELAALGSMILLFLVGLLTPAMNASLISSIGGGILVLAAVYQVQRRWRVNPVTWIAGLFLLVVGIYGLQTVPNLQGMMVPRGVPLGMAFPIGMFALIIITSALTGEF